MFQSKIVEKVKTHLLFSMIIFSYNRSVYEIMWENMVESDMPQVRM